MAYSTIEVIDMPRSARVKSATDIYHVMLRGINQTQLFYDDEDRHVFMDRLRRYKDKCEFAIYAYCLMGNHVHLLVKEGAIDMSIIIKKLTLSYSHWFNIKYDRSGFLFHGRYKREAVENDEYLLSVVRYIHNNPVKIGEEITFWSSYNEYAKKPHLVNTSLVLGMFSENERQARKLFSEFSFYKTELDETVLDVRAPTRLKDADAIIKIKKIAKVNSCLDLLEIDKTERNRLLALLKGNGITIRQLSRLTGINRNIIQKAGMTKTIA
jgi:REP element-mobilizing transposase RayT